jgi:hypothetical protein
MIALKPMVGRVSGSAARLHPSDNFGTVLAAAEQAGAAGEEFMLALAVAYEIQCRFTAVAKHHFPVGRPACHGRKSLRHVH